MTNIVIITVVAVISILVGAVSAPLWWYAVYRAESGLREAVSELYWRSDE